MLPTSEKFLPFDLLQYYYTSTWFHLDSRLVTEYDMNGNNPMIKGAAYEYGNVQHTLPTKITTTSSEGQQLCEELTYPIDYTISQYPDSYTHLDVYKRL